MNGCRHGGLLLDGAAISAFHLASSKAEFHSTSSAANRNLAEQ